MNACEKSSASSNNHVLVRVRLGEIEPDTCEVDQPHGHTAGELLADAQHWLALLLVQQHAELPQWANTDAALAHEIELTLASIQKYAATPAKRCLS